MVRKLGDGRTSMSLNEELQQNIAALAGNESWQAGLRLFLEGAVLESLHTPKSVVVRLANEHTFEQISVAIRGGQ